MKSNQNTFKPPPPPPAPKKPSTEYNPLSRNKPKTTNLPKKQFNYSQEPPLPPKIPSAKPRSYNPLRVKKRANKRSVVSNQNDNTKMHASQRVNSCLKLQINSIPSDLNARILISTLDDSAASHGESAIHLIGRKDSTTRRCSHEAFSFQD